jgi:branched-chain amino acid transport system substrate-binding protein
VVALVAALIAGCGGSGSPLAAAGDELTVYSDLPTTGPQGPWMLSIERGEILALDEAHRNDQDLDVNLVPFDDGDSGGWSPTAAQLNVNNATQDLDAIAYIGDFDSGATATTLPSTNRADILQISPSSSYIGLTDRNPVDGIGEPGRYYPSGVQTFARLVPSDVKEAVATTSFMRSLGIRSVYVLADDSVPYNGPFDSAIVPMVSRDATRAGISVAGMAQIDTASTTQPAGYASVAAAIAASHAAAVFVGAEPGPGAVALWKELYQRLPGVALFAPSTLGIGPFLDKLGVATNDTYVTSPILPLDQYPRRARVVLRAYRREYKTPPTAGTLYGYEAMESVLAAINLAGKHATNRSDDVAAIRLDVVHTYFTLGSRDKSVIGRYYITRHGDTSLSQFAGYRVGELGKLIEDGRFRAG